MGVHNPALRVDIVKEIHSVNEFREDQTSIAPLESWIRHGVVGRQVCPGSKRANISPEFSDLVRELAEERAKSDRLTKALKRSSRNIEEIQARYNQANNGDISTGEAGREFALLAGKGAHSSCLVAASEKFHRENEQLQVSRSGIDNCYTSNPESSGSDENEQIQIGQSGNNSSNATNIQLERLDFEENEITQASETNSVDILDGGIESFKHQDNEEVQGGRTKNRSNITPNSHLKTFEPKGNEDIQTTRIRTSRDNTSSSRVELFDGSRCSSIRNITSNSGLEKSQFLSSINQLSVACINVPEWKATDGEDIHRHNYEAWKDLLVNSLKLTGVEDEKTVFIIFKVKAGQRLLEIFRNTKSHAEAPDPQVAPFANAMQCLKSYFGSGWDVMLLRRRLALMKQKAHESDLNFITRVGSMARLCEFDGEKEFEQIVVTVAEHATRGEVRKAADLRMHLRPRL